MALLFIMRKCSDLLSNLQKKYVLINKLDKFPSPPSYSPLALRFYHSGKKRDSSESSLVKKLEKVFLSSLTLLVFFSFVAAGLWEPDGGALVGERVCLPADQPEAVRAPRGTDRLGRTPGLLTLRPLPDRQWETKLQVTHSSYRVCVCVWEGERGLCLFQAEGHTDCFSQAGTVFFPPRVEQPFELQSHVKVIQSWGSSMNKWMQIMRLLQIWVSLCSSINIFQILWDNEFDILSIRHHLIVEVMVLRNEHVAILPLSSGTDRK